MLRVSLGYQNGRLGAVVVEGYYKTICTDAFGEDYACVANVPLLEGAASTDNLAKMFRAVVTFLYQPPAYWCIDPMVSTPWWGANIVYKWRDWRQCASERVCSKPTYYLKYMPGCQLMYYNGEVGWFVSYDHQEGSHVLKYSRQALSVLRSLRRYHADLLVHCESALATASSGTLTRYGTGTCLWVL